MLERIIHSIAEKRHKRENAQRRLLETAIITAETLDHFHLNTGWKAQEFFLELKLQEIILGIHFYHILNVYELLKNLIKKGY